MAALMILVPVVLLGGLCGLPLAARAHVKQTQHMALQAIDPLPYLKASNAHEIAGFGSAVALSADGSTLVVGAPDGDAAYVFVRSSSGWVQQAMLKASNAEVDDQFGTSVGVSGDTIVVGAPYEDSSATGGPSDNNALHSGAAYVFTRSGTTWSQQAFLKVSNADIGDWFGLSVAISGENIVVGAVFESSSASDRPGDNSTRSAGAAYVFGRSGSTWSQQAFLKASNAEKEDGFGGSVAISGDTIVVGANGEDSSATGGPDDNSAKGAGAAYVFGRSGSAWSQQALLKASNAGVNDGFGYSVAISGDSIVVGAIGEDSSTTGGPSDNSQSSAGAAYVFGRSGTAWSQQAFLKASNAEAGDYFGASVSISGEAIVVGAIFEASSATGGPSDNSAPNAGAAYVFGRSSTTWSEHAFLKASNAEKEDRFGWSVANVGNSIVVGAPDESSSATGGLSDNSALRAGAAYPFGTMATPLQYVYLPLTQRN